MGWGVAGGEGWLGKGGRLEYQRGTDHGGGWVWLTGGRVLQEYNRTPLHWAAEKGHVAVMGLLLKAGADKEAQDRVWGGRVQSESGAAWCSLLWCRFGSVGTEWNDLSKMCVYDLVSLLQSEIDNSRSISVAT